MNKKSRQADDTHILHSTTKLKYKSQKEEKYQEHRIFSKNIKEETHYKLWGIIL